MEGLDRDYLEDLERRLRDAGRTASVDEANPATLEESDRDAEDADIQEAHDGHRRQQRLAGGPSCPYDHPLGYPLEVGLVPEDLEQKVGRLEPVTRCWRCSICSPKKRQRGKRCVGSTKFNWRWCVK